MNKECYTVSELGDAIGAPRTTVNDYLNRYSCYIESDVRGKRRVYLPKAVDVLKEIYAMRNNGNTFSEIEQELSKRYPLQAEIPEQSNFNSNKGDKMDTQEEKNQALVNIDEIRAIGQYLAKAEETRKKEIKNGIRRLFWPLILVLILVIVIGTGSILMGAKFLQIMKKDMGEIAEQNSQSNAKINEKLATTEQRLNISVRENMNQVSSDQAKQIESIIFKLEEKTQLQQKELTALRAEMVEQRKAESERFKELREAMSGKLERELEAAKDAHAGILAGVNAAKNKLSAELKAADTKLRDSNSANIALKAEKNALELQIKELEANLKRTEAAVKSAEAAASAAANMLMSNEAEIQEKSAEIQKFAPKDQVTTSASSEN